MKSELDILNFNGHDYLLSASAIPLDDHIFSHILGKNYFKYLIIIDKTFKNACFVLVCEYSRFILIYFDLKPLLNSHFQFLGINFH